jgi:exopolyphosphatase / guanosine-5'-triphosphate,3'-diphosphate pyrophosphatase
LKKNQTVMSPSDLAFPLRVGAIDIGSNAVRFSISEFLNLSSPSSRIGLHEQRVPVRLGTGAFRNGRLEEEGIEAAVRALTSFRQFLDSMGVTAYRAVATSAVRESDNGEDLVDRVREVAGIEIDVITGGEEARLVWTAVRDRLALEGRWMLADLGGGSIEVSIVNDTHVEWSESHTMGTVRMLEMLGGGKKKQSEKVLRKLIAEYVGTLRLPSVGKRGIEGVIATGGNIEALAALAGAQPDGVGVSRLSLDALRATNERLASLTFKERIEQMALREDRADVIVPAGLLYLRVAELAGAEEIVVPHVGVKDGVLLDLVEGLTTHAKHSSKQQDDVWDAAVALGRRYRFDEPHGVHVAKLVTSLFDQLEDEHGMDEDDRRTLLGAAILHDIGQFVSYRKHHKHSQYLILHGELSVFSTEELCMVAMVARYHRGADPSKDDHPDFKALDKDDQKRVLKMSALLRVADALDREHLQRVTALRATVEKHELVLEVEAQGDVLLELWAMERKGGLFKTVFDRDVRVTGVEIDS